ncbi:MAG: ISLre2 family transposase [Eubacteriales bacterium]|nr:ISLre2 family transposase [Eubacteriales bacterium]
MYQSILQFIEKDIKEIEKVLGNILTGEKDTDDLTKEVQDRLMNLAARWISEMYEMLDAEIRSSIKRKLHWTIEQRNEPKELLDTVGMLHFNRTGYKDKKTGKYIYLLDEILGLSGHQRMTIGAAANILEEAVLTSYAKGGSAASPSDAASKQTVKKLVHETEIDFPLPEVREKRKQKYLHIVADEDHVAAQFWKEKGDLEKSESGNKINTIMPKIIVVFEDVVDISGERSGSHRYRLVEKRTFCGVHKGTEANLRFWEEVRDYIAAVYDTDTLEKIYIAGDGAAWIKSGTEVLEKSCFVLDKFHMMKYINESVSHLLDSADEIKEEIWESINKADKEGLKRIYRSILKVTEEGNKYEQVKAARNYFMNQWNGIENRVKDAGARWRCCAEGQVSHVLSARMSSRPMGWSERGCDQMAKLRAYHWNVGKIIDLLRYQKKKERQEEKRKEQEELIKELRKKQKNWSYAEQMRAEVPGTEQHSMKWMRDIIYQALDA